MGHPHNRAERRFNKERIIRKRMAFSRHKEQCWQNVIYGYVRRRSILWDTPSHEYIPIPGTTAKLTPYSCNRSCRRNCRWDDSQRPAAIRRRNARKEIEEWLDDL